MKLFNFIIAFSILILFPFLSQSKQYSIIHDDESNNKENYFSQELLDLNLNFSRFKLIYEKNYTSPSEDLRRQKLYLSRASNVFKSIIAYKNNLKSYYLKINDKSDWTELELKQLIAFNSRDSFSSIKKTKHLSRNRNGFMNETFRRKNSLYNPAKKNEIKARGIKKTENSLLLDHRKSGCFSPIKNQKNCGSCYIFSTFALYEWHYCQESGLKVSFGVQMALDCGELVNMSGCRGGSEFEAASFAGKYGLELEQSYPYFARSYECPYKEASDQKKMGHFRLNDYDGFMVNIKYEHFYEFIETTPIVTAVGVPRDFFWYSNGVYKGEDCIIEDNWHSMIIVGHGVENGIRYWLMRNSYGPKFGLEGGYFKMNVDADIHCFADDGLGYILEPEVKIFNLNGNPEYNPAYVKQRYNDYLKKNPIKPNPYNYKFNRD